MLNVKKLLLEFIYNFFHETTAAPASLITQRLNAIKEFIIQVNATDSSNLILNFAMVCEIYIPFIT